MLIMQAFTTVCLMFQNKQNLRLYGRVHDFMERPVLLYMALFGVAHFGADLFGANFTKIIFSSLLFFIRLFQ